MNLQTVHRPDAERDLLEIADFLAGTSLAASDRFLTSVENSLDQLLKMPGLGEIVETSDPQFAGLRCWCVPRFKNYIIFYRPTEQGIEVLRVLHGARDIKGLLGDAEVPE